MNWAAGIVAFGAVIATTAVLLVFQFGQARIFFSMARDGLLPPSFAKIHPKYKTPYINTIWIGVVVAALSAFANLDVFVELTNIGTLFAFVLVCIGIMVLRVQGPGPQARVPDAFRPVDSRYLGSSFVSTSWRGSRPSQPHVRARLRCHVIGGLPWQTWRRFAVWLVLGLVIYFSYGIRKSRLPRRLNRDLRALARTGRRLAKGARAGRVAAAPRRELFARTSQRYGGKSAGLQNGPALLIGGRLAAASGRRSGRGGPGGDQEVPLAAGRRRPEHRPRDRERGVGQVVFDLGSTLKGTPIRKSSAKVRVRIDNNSETDEEVGVAVVVFDAEGNVVAAGSNGTKWGYLNKGDRTYYDIDFPYVYRRLDEAANFMVTLETKQKPPKNRRREVDDAGARADARSRKRHCLPLRSGSARPERARFFFFFFFFFFF